MRTILHWVDTAIATQPFYPDEIGMLRLTLQVWRYQLQRSAPFSPYRIQGKHYVH
jgi:hypothetical protein